MTPARGSRCPRIVTSGRARNGRAERGLPHPQPDDGELRCREGEEHAERVGAGEERRIAVRRDLGDDDRADPERGRDQDRLARDERAPLEARELARKRAVLGERVREAGDARDRRRRGGEQDERARDADRHPQRVDEDAGQLAVERGGDADERRFSHSSPSAVSPPVTGYADRPMAAIRTVTSTTSPIAEKSERGSARPGSRASSARLATVSRPVYASIASGSAKARSPHSWPLAKPRPSRSVSGESEEREPEHDQHAAGRPDRAPRSRARPSAGACAEEAHPRDRRDDEAPDHASHGTPGHSDESAAPR